MDTKRFVGFSAPGARSPPIARAPGAETRARWLQAPPLDRRRPPAARLHRAARGRASRDGHRLPRARTLSFLAEFGIEPRRLPTSGHPVARPSEQGAPPPD